MSTCELSCECAGGSDNCTQKLPTVKLDPTTKLGASCALAGRSVLGDDYPCFEVMPYSPPE